ncbi:hypothetical protein ACFRAQ_36210 [Nocardia sp. NPDC056611]|uniref:hypothetical protein n=1 Tax=Nocardia sp. NPDC056611 TaxID=3345877 RepID=UPI0036707196
MSTTRELHSVVARAVELTPTTILIDGESLPWPLSPDWSITYRPHAINKRTWLLSFAVLVGTVSGIPDHPTLDGHPIPWTLASPGVLVDRFKSDVHRVTMTVLVHTSIGETE